jgi:GntR family transcriptional regulator
MGQNDLGKLDKAVPIPFYYQITDILLRKIESKEYKPHERIPSEDEFAAIFNVSRMTVRQAVLKLVNEGKLYRRQGYGTFVAEPKIERKVAKLTSATLDIKEAGLEPGSIILERNVLTPAEEVRRMLSLGSGDEIIEIIRLRLADGEPIAISRAILPVRIFPQLVTAGLEGVLSLTQFLEQEYGCKIAYAEQKIQAVSADSYQSKLLKIKRGSPLLYLNRIFHSNAQSPIGIFDSFYRGDRYIFTSTLYR